LAFAPRILHDTSLLMLDTALGPAEALALEWRDIHFEASAESPFGYLRGARGEDPLSVANRESHYAR